MQNGAELTSTQACRALVLAPLSEGYLAHVDALGGLHFLKRWSMPHEVQAICGCLLGTLG